MAVKFVSFPQEYCVHDKNVKMSHAINHSLKKRSPLINPFDTQTGLKTGQTLLCLTPDNFTRQWGVNGSQWVNGEDIVTGLITHSTLRCVRTPQVDE